MTLVAYNKKQEVIDFGIQAPHTSKNIQEQESWNVNSDDTNLSRIVKINENSIFGIFWLVGKP